MAKKLAEIVEVLERPTPPNEVSFIPRGVAAKGDSKKDGYATAIPYIDSTFVENTLDEAAGKFGWQSDIKQVSGVMCQGIGIVAQDVPDWVWRWDVGLEKEQEEHGSKAEVTAGLKRAARQWGIGRDLKDYPKLRLPCKIYMNAKGKATFIDWAVDPRAAVMDMISRGIKRVSNGNGDEESGGSSTAAAQPSGPAPGLDSNPQITGATQGEQPDDVSPAQARRMCYDFAIQKIEMSNKETNAWINDQEKEHGRTLESYRTIYGLLQAKFKANQPPPH